MRTAASLLCLVVLVMLGGCATVVVVPGIDMARYLFRFGYCTPKQWSANETHGWDDESSSAFFVDADSAEAALAWGEEIAEAFVQSLFSADGRTEGAPSWKESQFAHWIDESYEESFSVAQLEKLPVMRVGEPPEHSQLVALAQRYFTEG